MNIDICRKCPFWHERIQVVTDSLSRLSLWCARTFYLKCFIELDHRKVVDAMKRNVIKNGLIENGDAKFNDIAGEVEYDCSFMNSISTPETCAFYAEQQMEEWNR